MKKIIPLLSIIICGLFASPAFAQDGEVMIIQKNNCEAMAAEDFDQLCTVMKGRAAEETKLKQARQSVKKSCISVKQLAQLLDYLQLDEHRLDLAKFSYDYCSNPDKYAKVVLPKMKSADSTESLNNFLDQQ
ncbi:MAG: DUF4476 domain-containing protein [Crocinitomicaceae bacterium]